MGGPFLDLLFDSTITNIELIGLLLVPGMIYGLRRGWQEEGFTAVGLAIAVSPLGQRFANFLILLASRLAGVFPLGLAILLNRPPDQWPNLSEGVIPQDNPWAQLIAFVLIVLVCYRAGAILGRRRGVNVLGRVAGALFGGMNVFLIIARIFFLVNPLEEGVSVELPTITIVGLSSALLNNVIYGMIGFIIALFLLLAWFNRRRARE